MTRIPTLRSDRLVLRAFNANDEAAYIAMMSDPDVSRYLGDGLPMSAFDAWRQLAMLIGHWELRGFGMWAVEERASGALIGRIGCLEPVGWPGFEVGYVLRKSAWGRGYAREGVAMSLQFAREVLGKDRIISIIRPGNLASVRVAESFGAVTAQHVELFGGVSDVYEYPPVA